jgi:hypothetical protein
METIRDTPTVLTCTPHLQHAHFPCGRFCVLCSTAPLSQAWPRGNRTCSSEAALPTFQQHTLLQAMHGHVATVHAHALKHIRRRQHAGLRRRTRIISICARTRHFRLCTKQSVDTEFLYPQTRRDFMPLFHTTFSILVSRVLTYVNASSLTLAHE